MQGIYTRKYILILIFAGLLLFVNFLNNKFLGDDEDQIVNNPLIAKITNIPGFFSGSTYYSQETKQSYGLYYRPLMLSSYTLIYQLGGVDSLYFHLFQVVLHIANSALILLIFSHFFPEIPAFLLALIFLVHPINNETVVYIADLQDILFVFFGLLSFLALIGTGKEKIKINRLFKVAFLLLLSFFSKETGILFGAMLIVYTFLRNRKNTLRISITVSIPLITFFFFRFILAGSSIYSKDYTLIGQATPGIRLITAPKAIVNNFRLFIFPRDLVLNEMWLVKSIKSPDFYIQVLLLIIIIFSLIYSGARLKKENLENYRLYVFFCIWMATGILMHSQIIPLSATYTTRWFYFPVIGLLGITGILLTPIFKNAGNAKIITAIFAVIIFILSARTITRNSDWKDPYRLYSHDIRVAGGNYFLENSLASLYIEDGNIKQAKPLVLSSVKQFPYFGNLNNLAIINVSEKDNESAGTNFRKAIDAGGNYMVYRNYGNFLFLIKKDFAETKNFVEKALIIYPESERFKTILKELRDLGV